MGGGGGGGGEGGHKHMIMKSWTGHLRSFIPKYTRVSQVLLQLIVANKQAPKAFFI